ncbi:MAG: hypothetical protein IPI46_10460 [Bacteroidetes bacterium]|nr:hypothetical protein [Bacteroidota bacterium]
MKNSILVLLLLCSAMLAKAQEFANVSPERAQVHSGDITKMSAIEKIEDTLVFLADSMYFSQLDDSRITGNEEFIKVFKRLLKLPNSYNAALAKLKNKIVIMPSPDKLFKMYNWEIVRNNVERRYYCVIQMEDGTVHPFIDISDQVIRGIEDSIFTNQRWFGTLYYNLIMKESDAGKHYFLLGWNGNSLNSEKKIVDVLQFDTRGKCSFGAPVFDVLERGKRKKTNRFVMEYEKAAKVSLNYDKESGQIIFDHCESQIGDPAKKYTYVPDGTYDGLKWNGNEMVMNENVIQITILKDGEAPIER